MPPPLSPPPSRDCEIQRRGSLSSPVGAHTSRARLNGLHAAPHPPRAAAASFSTAARSLARLKGVCREIKAQQSKYGTSTGASRRGGQGRAQGRSHRGWGRRSWTRDVLVFLHSNFNDFQSLEPNRVSPSNQTGPKKIRKKIAEGFVINLGIDQRVVLPSLSFACLPWSYMSLIFRRPDDMAESVCL